MKEFQNIVFFTGAGLSVESGIPTYRGRGGIWENYNYQEYACQEAFASDPEKVWDFHDKRRAMIKSCDPNPAHRIIAEVQRRNPQTTIITQNIDGLHQRAGARNVIELHGSIWRLRCSENGVVEENFEVPLAQKRCGRSSWWRPDIVWFGDSLREDTINLALKALQRCDLFLCIGTSAVVYPAARMPQIAIDNGAETIEINPEETPISALFNRCIRSSASLALAEIFPG